MNKLYCTYVYCEWVPSLHEQCKDEVRNCRQIAATKMVMLKENPNTETPESAGQPAAKSATLKAKGDLEQEPHYSKRLGLLFHDHGIFQILCIQVCPKRQLS